MLYIRFLFDKPGNSIDVSTGDEISMAEVIQAAGRCNGTLTINAYGVTYAIDMEKVAMWYPIRLHLGE